MSGFRAGWPFLRGWPGAVAGVVLAMPCPRVAGVVVGVRACGGLAFLGCGRGAGRRPCRPLCRCGLLAVRAFCGARACSSAGVPARISPLVIWPPGRVIIDERVVIAG